MGKNAGRIIGILLTAVILLGAFTIATYMADAETEETITEEVPTAESTMQQAEPTQGENESKYGKYIIQGPVWGITDEERELAERVVAAEARGESMECMMAVAQTIRDRSITRKQSVTEVLTAANQFAAPYSGEITERIEDAVSFVFDEGISVFDYPVTHFYASHLIDPPDWTYEMEFLGEIDGVSFYRQ